MQAIYDAIINFFNNFWQWVLDFWDNFKLALSEIIEALIEAIQQAFITLFEFFQPVIDFFSDAIYFFEAVGQVILKFFTLMWQLIMVLTSVVQGAGNTIASLYAFDSGTAAVPNNPFLEGIGVFLTTVDGTGFNIIPYILMFMISIYMLLRVGELVRGRND